MNKIILITKPNFDDTTFYISHYSNLITEEAKKKGIITKSFEGKETTRENIHKFVNKQKPKFLFLNGHGNSESIEGNKGEIIFSINDKHLFSEEIIYARSCLLGEKFGKEVFENKKGCFIGYKYPFMFYIDETNSSNPSKDKIAQYFLEPSNKIASAIIKGNTTEEANNKGKKATLKNIKKMMIEEKNSFLMIGALWNNYEGQVLYGNEEQKFE
jgi:hypothetical protein